MKLLFKALIIFTTTMLISCGGKEKKIKERFSYEKSTINEDISPKVEAVSASQRIDLKNKGVGPVKELNLPSKIDQAMATQGEDVYTKMCTACHRPDKKFIGPATNEILKRRTPEWVMNMILDPEAMIKKDSLAQDLLKEFNGSPMINQGLTEVEARAILEYFRKTK